MGEIVQPKIPQIPQNLNAQVLDFNEKKASLGIRSPCLQHIQEENQFFRVVTR